MKRLFKGTQKNKGFSLVEVLVAMTVIALISIPLIRTFVISANVNSKGRKLKNASDIAQNVSEYFTTIELSELKDKFRNDTGLRTNVLYDDSGLSSSGAYVFQNIGGGDVDEDGVPYYEGADGEDFYVTVVLNPAGYSNGSSSDVGNINNFVSPEIGDLFSLDIVTAFSQFTKYDNKIKTTFKRTFTADQVPHDVDYSNIKKTATVFIDQKQNASNPRKIDCTYSLTVKYTYCTKNGNDYIETPYSVDYHFVLFDGIVDATGLLPDLYLLYTPYDVNDPSHTGMFARDEIYINYRKGQVRETWEKDVNLYIVQQDGPEEYKGLNFQNIYLNAYSDITVPAVTKYNAYDKFQMYTNVVNWPEDHKVTAGNTTMVKLYTVDVYVWYDKKDITPIDDYVDPSFKPTKHLTYVSTVKEE